MQNNPVLTKALDAIAGSVDNHSFWMDVRNGLLMLVDAIERQQCIQPTTSKIRGDYKHRKHEESSPKKV
jgi:hypothetical protein